MRGTVAKRLRRFAKEDMPTFEWEAYTEVTPNPRKPESKSVRLLPECQKYHYRFMKHVWKTV